MTVTREFVIWCDACGDWERDCLSRSVTAMRKHLKTQGWTRVPATQETPVVRDFCLHCSNKEAERKKE